MKRESQDAYQIISNGTSGAGRGGIPVVKEEEISFGDPRNGTGTG